MDALDFPDVRKVQAIGERAGAVGRQAVAIALLEAIRPRVVLDVGSKDGWMIRALRESVNPDLAVAMDTVPRAGAAPVMGGDARHLPFGRERFDAVLLLDVIEHLPRRTEAQAIDEARRVLTPGGWLLVSTPSSWWVGRLLDPAWWLRGHRHYPMEQLSHLLERGGFRVEATAVRGGLADVIGLPLLYLTVRLHVQMPFERALLRWGWKEYSRPGRYTNFVLSRKSE